MDNEVAEFVQGILSLLKKTGKLPLLPQIIERLKEEVKEEKIAWVKVAALPTEEEKREIIDYVNKVFGKPLKVNFEVDLSLLGGLVIQFEDKILDQSLKGELRDLKEKINYGY